MQPRTSRRFIIRRIGSNPPQYYQTKSQKKIRRKKEVEDVTIDRILGFWGNSMGKASVFTDNTRRLPADCEFVEKIKSQPTYLSEEYDQRYYTRLRPGPL